MFVIAGTNSWLDEFDIVTSSSFWEGKWECRMAEPKLSRLAETEAIVWLNGRADEVERYRFAFTCQRYVR